jgi:hypothetical protein
MHSFSVVSIAERHRDMMFMINTGIRALLSPFPTKLHMSPIRWPDNLAWGHGSHRKQGENRHK